jgi:hypothetical protein
VYPGLTETKSGASFAAHPDFALLDPGYFRVPTIS